LFPGLQQRLINPKKSRKKRRRPIHFIDVLAKRQKKFWPTPFRITSWESFNSYAEELISVIKQLDEVTTGNVENVEIAGLVNGLTTKWYSYNFLNNDNKAVAKLREFIKAEVRRYILDLGHEVGPLYLQSWANLLKRQETFKTHSHAGPYSYISGVFFVKTMASSTKYFLPLDRRIPGVEDFYEREIEVKNIEGGLVIFPSFIEHSSTPTLKKIERITVAFDVLKEAPIDRYHNGFGYKVIDTF